MPIADRLLLVYYGPFLAGRHTSIAYAMNRHPLYADRVRGELAIDGVTLDLHLQITRYRSFLGPAPYSELIASDAHLPEREALKGELSSLGEASAIVFVADAITPEANASALAQLPIDLREAGRDPVEIPVVFQLNKQDLVVLGRAPAFDRSTFDWPRSDFVETTASTGRGTREALERAVRMAMDARQRVGPLERA